MPAYFLVPCPCGRQLRADRKQAASSLRCWGCGGSVSVRRPRSPDRTFQAFIDGLKDTFRPEVSSILVGGAILGTATLAIPTYGLPITFSLLVLAAFRFQDLFGESGLLEGDSPNQPDHGRLWALRAILAVASVAALIAPVALRNGGTALPSHDALQLNSLIIPALTAWLVMPLILLAYNAYDRHGPVSPRRVVQALLRHPLGTLASLMVLPAGLLAVEVILFMVATYYDHLSLLTADLFPTPVVVAADHGSDLIYHFDDETHRVSLVAGEVVIRPVYFAALRHGYTLVGTIPASLSWNRIPRIDPFFFRTHEQSYLAFRILVTLFILHACGVLLAVQARWLAALVSIESEDFSDHLHPSSGSASPIVVLPHLENLASSPLTPPSTITPLLASRLLATSNGAGLSKHAPVNQFAPLPTPAFRSGQPYILIIEPEAHFAAALGRILAERGFAVALAGDAQEGLQQALVAPPDLIVLDLALPDRPGPALLRELRATSTTHAVPILVTTPKADAAEEIACLDLGADDYLVKPYAIDVFVAHLRRRLQHAQVATPPAVQLTPQ